MNGIRDRRGAALIEFAIVSLLLFTLVFGIIEFGLMMRDFLTLNQAVREGVRSAALGATVGEVASIVTTSAVSMDTTKLQNIAVSYRIRGDGGTWPADWIAGTPEAVDPSDDVQVKVSASYVHDMLFGSLFGAGPKILRAEMVMRRE